MYTKNTHSLCAIRKAYGGDIYLSFKHHVHRKAAVDTGGRFYITLDFIIKEKIRSVPVSPYCLYTEPIQSHQEGISLKQTAQGSGAERK